MNMFNFTECSNGNNSLPLPAGEYTARVISGEECISQAGNEMYRVTLEILRGTSSIEVMDFFVKHQEQAMSRLRNLFIAALVCDSRDLTPTINFPLDLFGKKVLVHIEANPKDNRFNRVRFEDPYGPCASASSEEVPF